MLTADYIEALLEQAAPPDPELADLLEKAFLEEQPDGQAWSWLICGCWAARLAR